MYFFVFRKRLQCHLYILAVINMLIRVDMISAHRKAFQFFRFCWKRNLLDSYVISYGSPVPYGAISDSSGLAGRPLSISMYTHRELAYATSFPFSSVMQKLRSPNNPLKSVAQVLVCIFSPISGYRSTTTCHDDRIQALFRSLQCMIPSPRSSDWNVLQSWK